MAAQAISALVQVSEPTPPSQLGISSAQASQLGVTIMNGVTPAFWIFSILMVVLVVSITWMLITPQIPVAAATTAPSPWAPPPSPSPEAAPSANVTEDEDDVDWDDEDEDATEADKDEATS
jgi:hypothetical protein